MIINIINQQIKINIMAVINNFLKNGMTIAGGKEILLKI